MFEDGGLARADETILAAGHNTGDVQDSLVAPASTRADRSRIRRTAADADAGPLSWTIDLLVVQPTTC